MNARMLSQETSPQSHCALPDAWIARLFDHMAAMYGSKFADLWAGTDSEKVREMWARKLAGFADQPGAIKSALDALDERPFPPTLPEFISLCRDAARRIGSIQQALPHKLSAEELENNRKRIAEMVANLAKAKAA